MGRGTHNAQRKYTDAQRTWAEETEAWQPAESRGAEWADRAERDAWAGRVFKSSYAHLLEIPDVVGAADRATAYKIKVRLEEVMDRGGYTTNEWNRLHKLHQQWSERAAGEDLGFMTRGWKRQGDGRHTPKIERMLKEMREVVGNG